MRDAALRVLLVALIACSASAAWAAPAAAVPTVRVTVAPGDPSAGDTDAVSLEPAVQVAEADSVSWQVTNRSTRTLDVELSLRALARMGDEGDVAPGAQLTDVVFEDRQVRLDPGETATATVARRDLAEEVGAGIALVARSPDADFEDLVGMVVAARAAPRQVDVDLERVDGRLRGRVEVTTDRALMVDVRARLVTWPSRIVTDRTVRDVVVLPPGREVELDLAGTAFVGPVDLEVVAGAPADSVGGIARAWIVNRTAVRTLGAVVLLLTLATLGATMWRRRRP